MKIKVECCFNGHKLFYNLSIPNERGGNRYNERVYSDSWDRATAKEALNLLENVYHLKRSNIRFVHK
jgi:hypothetical protein